MKLDILMSCMHQRDAALIHASNITGSAVVINQCDREEYAEFTTANGIARIFSVRDRGLTRSRNMAIGKSDADVCLLCDDDEVFVDGYEEKILRAYGQLPDADVVIFKMSNRRPSFPDRVMRLRFPKTMKVSSWQISFRRESLLKSGVGFDELMGAGTGNGAEEELKFLLDCQKAGLRIYYVPTEIASVGQVESTWFSGFTEDFFENRGATNRYILGIPLAVAYGIYYLIKKRPEYGSQISTWCAMKAFFRGMKENKIARQRKQLIRDAKGL